MTFSYQNIVKIKKFEPVNHELFYLKLPHL